MSTALARFICVSSVALLSLTADAAGRADRFSFDYVIQGDAGAKPAQVFDDGRKTYLQFREADQLPVLTSINGQPLAPIQEGAYVVLNGVPRDFYAAMGTARVRITFNGSPVQQAEWTVKKSDQTVEKMLTRWATDAGWKLAWNGAPTVEITADSARPLNYPDFVSAADYVVSQMKASGYSVKATAYNNQTLVITGE